MLPLSVIPSIIVIKNLTVIFPLHFTRVVHGQSFTTKYPFRVVTERGPMLFLIGLFIRDIEHEYF